MKTKVKELKDNQVEVTVTVDAKDIDTRIKKTYKDVAYKYNFPGFRRGKAPRQVINNALGAEGVLATVTEDVLKETYPVAIDESDIYPISNPDFGDDSSFVTEGKPFTYTMTLTVKPEFELSSYDPVAIELPGEEATEEEIETQINALREHYFTFEDAAASTKLEEGGTAEIAMKVTDENGEAVEALDSDARVYTLGSGIYPEDFDKALVGLKKGQKKSFDLEFKGLFTAGLAAVAGKLDKAHFDVEVKGVKKKVLPKADDVWAKDTCGFESLDDLRARISEQITQEKTQMLPGLKENQCLHELAERLKGEVPEAMVETNESELLQNFFQQLQAQGASLDAYLMQQGLTIDQFKEDVKRQAADLAKQDLALDAWARHQEMKITSKEMTEEFKKSGAEDPKALEKEWRENGQLHNLRQGMLRVRAINDIMENAVVSEPGKKKPAKKAAPKKTTATKKESTGAPAEKKPATKPAAKKAPVAKTGTSAAKKAAPKKAADK